MQFLLKINILNKLWESAFFQIFVFMTIYPTIITESPLQVEFKTPIRIFAKKFIVHRVIAQEYKRTRIDLLMLTEIMTSKKEILNSIYEQKRY